MIRLIVYINKTIPSVKPLEIDDKKPKYKIGNLVRISKVKKLFEQGYTPNWSNEVYKVKTINDTSPKTYTLEDLKGEIIDGKFYQQELQITKIPNFNIVDKIVETKTENKIKNFLVSFKGWHPKFNEWVDKKGLDILKGKILKITKIFARQENKFYKVKWNDNSTSIEPKSVLKKDVPLLIKAFDEKYPYFNP